MCFRLSRLIFVVYWGKVRGIFLRHRITIKSRLPAKYNCVVMYLWERISSRRCWEQKVSPDKENHSRVHNSTIHNEIFCATVPNPIHQQKTFIVASSYPAINHLIFSVRNKPDYALKYVGSFFILGYLLYRKIWK